MHTFSPKGYTDLIRSILSAGYRFVTPDALDFLSSDRQVLLRHDVDYSPRKAVEMAQLDHSLGVCSVFFFLVRGHWYNWFGHYTQAAVQEIHTMGFQIGIHYAPPPNVGDDQTAHQQQLLQDLSLMRAEFPLVYPAVSWHVPPPLAFQRNRFPAPDGLIDLYSERFFHQTRYVSDSSLRNSYQFIQQLFMTGEHPRVQLVLHPECWLGNRDMAGIADLVGEIMRSVIADGEADLREKADYRALLPMGMPQQVWDQVADLIVATIEKARSMSQAPAE